jgi:two-component system chemotaxis response regulator CheB
VLRGLPASSPGIIIVQHLPAGFTAAFANRLNRVCRLEVREARDHDRLVPGLALVAPGNRHLLLERRGSTYLIRIKDGSAVQFQRPSIDVFFQSVACSAGRLAVGVLLTGMGTDGAKGLLAMRQAGARTLVQDEASCVVFGMPKEAIRLGAATEVVPLSQVGQALLGSLRRVS